MSQVSKFLSTMNTQNWTVHPWQLTIQVCEVCYLWTLKTEIFTYSLTFSLVHDSWAKSIPQKNLFEGNLGYLQRGIWGNDPDVLLSFRSSRLANLRRRRCIYQKCTANRKYLDQNLPNGQHCQKFLLHPRYLHLLGAFWFIFTYSCLLIINDNQLFPVYSNTG